MRHLYSSCDFDPEALQGSRRPSRRWDSSIAILAVATDYDQRIESRGDMHLKLLPGFPPEGRVARKMQLHYLHQGWEPFGG